MIYSNYSSLRYQQFRQTADASLDSILYAVQSLSARVTALQRQVDTIDLVNERVLDLLESDETYDKSSGKARKLLRGTNVVLLEKDVVGSTCVDSVSIAE